MLDSACCGQNKDRTCASGYTKVMSDIECDPNDSSQLTYYCQANTRRLLEVLTLSSS